jgi:hypothetical protein
LDIGISGDDDCLAADLSKAIATLTFRDFCFILGLTCDVGWT